MNQTARWPERKQHSIREFLQQILSSAFQQQFSDLYFLPKVGKYQLSGQQLGRLQQIMEVSIDDAKSMLSLMKYWAQLDLAEMRRPQLGRFDFEDGFVRLSSVGDFLGRESLVLRLISKQVGPLAYRNEQQWKELLADRPSSGLYLLVGPTGSGKTTTLHELLRKWSDQLIVLTVEDPVEIEQPAFLQLQVNNTAGVHYQDLIKVALRHRPDILVIGEIRDLETAQAALQAALSGHLVLATIHANSAELVLERLVDLGLDRELVLEALVKSVYMRLCTKKSGGLEANLTVVDWRNSE